MSDNNNGRTFMRAGDILPSQHLKKLGSGARRVYATVWNNLNNRNYNECWIYDEDLSRRSRVSASLLPIVKDELVTAGLLHITPGLVQTRYRVTDPDSDTEAELGVIDIDIDIDMRRECPARHTCGE